MSIKFYWNIAMLICLCVACVCFALQWQVEMLAAQSQGPQSLKYLPSGPLQKNFAHPVRKLHSLNRNDHKPVWWKTAFPICLFVLNYRKKWDPTKAQDRGWGAQMSCLTSWKRGIIKCWQCNTVTGFFPICRFPCLNDFGMWQNPDKLGNNYGFWLW